MEKVITSHHIINEIIELMQNQNIKSVCMSLAVKKLHLVCQGLSVGGICANCYLSSDQEIFYWEN